MGRPDLTPILESSTKRIKEIDSSLVDTYVVGIGHRDKVAIDSNKQDNRNIEFKGKN